MKRPLLLSLVAASALLVSSAPASAGAENVPPPAKHEITAKAEQFSFLLPDRFANGDPLATVTFAAGVDDGEWKELGTARRAPYRVHHDLAGLPAGAELEYRAAVRDSEGRTASVRSRASVATPPPGGSRDWLVVHYDRPSGGYDGWGLYAWGDIDPAWQTQWPAGQPFAGEDAYGRFAWVKLKSGAKSVGFLVVSADGVKDVEADRFVDVTEHGEVWVRQGDPAVQTGREGPPVEEGAAILHKGDTKDKDLSKARAHWIDKGSVAWQIPSTGGKRYELAVAPAGGLSIVDGELAGAHTRIPLAARRNGLTEKQRGRFPHLWQYTVLEVARRDQAKVKELLRGQVVVTERDREGKLLAATGVQIPGVLDDVYAGRASGAALGPTVKGDRATLAVWAPTARSVALELYDTPSGSPGVTPMRRDDKSGVWSATGPWRGRFYKFRVEAWQPAVQRVVTASVTDPYSVALAADSTHSLVADLTDPALSPAGWDRLRKPAAVPATRTQITELSVRDFSIADTTVPAARRGTYAAFGGGAGATHLRKLAEAGVTHVHLLPAFDFATIPERRADQAVPPCDLAALPPDSDKQQACVAEVADRDGYNWGYDPLHYTVPEGGYAVEPGGAARTREFREMVAALNRGGLRVVMDVVYNHTSASGVDDRSVLDQIVPGYYHRLLPDGTVANSTCCANTAPEHAMMGKLVVDSVVTWARQYKVDGFRFDLMGHHPRDNILAVRKALDQLTVRKDGVDGKAILLYGEGWDFGEVAGGARFVQATQANMAGTGIATFNDRLRDAVRGGGPFDANPRQQGFASGLYTDPNGDPVNGSDAEQRRRLLHQHDQIKVGLTGNLAGYRFTDTLGKSVTGAQVDYNGSPAGYTAAPGEAVTYVDAHDNEILYDALAYKLPQATAPLDRARMQVLALATVVLGQGIGFVTAGSERLRSKSLDRNSYNSGDWFNQIRWDCADGNGFGAGLPPAADNQDKWQYARPLLADPALVPDCAAIGLAEARYAELLRIRASSPLFALGSAAEVQRKLSFPLSGPLEVPGVITMQLGGGAVTVVFNATKQTVTQPVPSMRGTDATLHPVLKHSADPVLRTATFDPTTGTFTVPPRSVAVFVRS
ncbi:pullulanase-type alpha-1,6-glucosidase [Phytohabitans sp. ZYX-F-186]|uniref:1,4-alpha-D-glucan glucanohydrolase n=1 Tax=Phytohabitans maris TaxID=3071409 RepID=A0ABU0ZCV5_9ACTN|nr:pullulanase-type alpha-1,6-glucosidase [Phytohabitans sp. ZYX-F-186]MDQ7904269.1 pullulanase-type alpha-1,6-glucosidase [Phytohabitans sp. ZYX-F-186]